jgi:hypothetical protein
MANASMTSEPLSEAQKQRAREILQSRFTDRTCPSCGGEQWGLQERLHVMPAIDPSGTVDPSMGFPALILTCKECFQVRLFNAAQMGIVERG